jgi:hypothetical protein
VQTSVLASDVLKMGLQAALKVVGGVVTANPCILIQVSQGWGQKVGAGQLLRLEPMQQVTCSSVRASLVEQYFEVDNARVALGVPA